MNKWEKSIQLAVCLWVKKEYPNILYRVDLGGERSTMGQGVQVKKMQKCRAWPDLHFPEARMRYHGLYIETKTGRDQVWNKNGIIKKDKHIREQYFILAALRFRGYKAEFGYGYYDILELIKSYLS